MANKREVQPFVAAFDEGVGHLHGPKASSGFSLGCRVWGVGFGLPNPDVGLGGGASGVHAPIFLSVGFCVASFVRVSRLAGSEFSALRIGLGHCIGPNLAMLLRIVNAT